MLNFFTQAEEIVERVHPDCNLKEILSCDQYSNGVYRVATSEGDRIIKVNPGDSSRLTIYFENEVRALMLLRGLPYTPELEGTTREEEWVALEKDYVEGQTLEENPSALYSINDAQRLVGLIHQRGVCHLDLKRKSNWLVNQGGFWLFDFDVAKFREDLGERRFKNRMKEDIHHLLTSHYTT